MPGWLVHSEALEYLRSHIPTGIETVLDLGSREAGEGRVRDLFPSTTPYLGLDHVPGTGVDLVVDIESPLFYNSEFEVIKPEFDLVVCAEVLEHTADPRAVLSNAHNALRGDGILLVTCAGPGREPHSCVIPGPPQPNEHYRNLDPTELESLLWEVGFKWVVVERDLTHHDLYASARRP
jgi:SAM-dependent methyltransferase